MGYTSQEEWDAHYRDGSSFRPLGDSERELLAAHVPAPDGGLALDVGCGLGELARHLASVGYRTDAVDYAPAAVAAASAADGVGELPVEFLRFDVERDDLAALPHPAYDLITFRLSLAFVADRTRVLNRLRGQLGPGGALCVITPVADAVPEGRRDIALDEDEIDVLCAGWGKVQRYDAEGLAFLVLRDPAPARVAFRGKGRPRPHALTGAGVVVTDAAGRVLLGLSVDGAWELPGGKNEPGEAFTAAAVRELAEETGLRAGADDARLLAVLMDAVDDMPRVTAAVRVTAHTGEPRVTEPELIRRWEWHEVRDLPALAQALFTPSAHVIDTVWPGLLPGLPPVHRHLVVEHTDRRTDGERHTCAVRNRP
ncbi:bifunctional class I SAM-dependent methyltransferase/NUDIX hydrolase [Streptomyces kanamyceticus]|uniref:NUDIX domain-containing protein n=1 Tax=Streptomyces kanamyceticus TaxID=1967 RepID=A0A5J6G582_STRKN|nr:NUDIX domain-containing protein [Streptomyces kanamyceticus]QEU90087.1 NUDIX domain-containing protein [Streptomyces kanamyceticus]